MPINPSQTPVKTIRLAFISLYNPQGDSALRTRGFEGLAGQRVWLKNIFTKAAQLYANNTAPSDPVAPIFIPDTRIRLVLDTMIFKPTSSAFFLNTIDVDTLNDIFGYQPSITINVYFNLATYQNATAHALMPTLDPILLNYIQGVQFFKAAYLSYQKFCFSNPVPLSTECAPFLCCVSQSEVMGQALAHEIGHCLGLIHTYQGGGTSFNCSDTTSVDYYTDIFGLPNDTIPCPHFGGWQAANNLTPSGVLNDTVTNNLMGGNAAAAYMSAQQIGRMHRELSLSSARKYVTGSPYSPTPFPTYVVSQNETWSHDMRIYNDVVVTAGCTLTVTCRLYFSNGGHIYVQPNGTLILNGGLLSCYRSGLWKGVEAWSTASFGGAIQFGRVIMTNGAIIEHAEIGVLLGKRATTGGGLDPNVTAGLLQADGVNSPSIIRNCLNGAYFTRTFTGPGFLNSTIKNCIFTHDANNRLANPFLQVMYHVRGTQGAANVSVTNNDFSELPNSAFSTYGVFAQDANITVQNNTFTGLRVGVQFQNAASTYFPGAFVVNENYFNGCRTGIFVLGLWQAFQIDRNRVNDAATSYDKNTATRVGIYASGAYGVTITNNHIKNCTYGAYISDCYYGVAQQNQIGLTFNGNDISYVIRCLQTEKTVEFSDMNCNRFDKWGTIVDQRGAAWWNIGQIYNTFVPSPDTVREVGLQGEGLINYFLTNATNSPPSPYRDIVNEPAPDESPESVRFRYWYKKPQNNAPCNIASLRPVYPVSSCCPAYQSTDACHGSSDCGNNGGGGSTGKSLGQLLSDLQDATTPKARRKILGEIIKLYRKNDQDPTPFLATLNDITVKQSLIPYFVATGNIGQAQAAINTLPVNDPARVYFQILLDLKTQDKGIKQASVGQAAQVLQLADMTNTHPLRHTARAFMRIYNDTIIQDALPPDPEGFGGKYEQDEETGGGLYKQNDNSITLYPNPTNGSLTVSFSQNIDRPYRLQFTDLYGRVVFTQNLTSQENLLDLSPLAQGVYAYTLFAPDGSVSKQGRIARR